MSIENKKKPGIPRPPLEKGWKPMTWKVGPTEAAMIEEVCEARRIGMSTFLREAVQRHYKAMRRGKVV
jgi:hypothetical protein